MSFKVENLEAKNMVKLIIEASAEEFEKGVQAAYLKNRNKMAVPGFRKGKVPRQVIEKMYGTEVFFEDAVNAIIPDAYAKAAEESGLDIVSQPSIDVVQLEKGKPFIFSAEVAIKPEVTLGDYKGIEVEKADLEVSEEEINAEIDKARKQNSRKIAVEDRAIVDGDEAIIDFEGFVDGVAFEGGKGENYSLKIGSHSFIDTFEEQLIGKNIGDEVEVNVTFPEDYHAADLAGKPALFKVAVKEIKAEELPELDDEFASEVSEFDTLAEYKEDVKKTVAERKEKAAKTDKENAVVEKVVANAKMDIPEAMVETQVRQMADEFAQRIQSQGLSIEQYFQFTGLTPDKLLEEMKPQAVKRIESRLVLEAVVKAENIEASDEDVEKELENMASMYQMEIEKIKEFMGPNEIEAMKKDLAVQKAVDFLVESAVEK
ncbi:MAG: trigger factor [Lachnospiraceae bacterium]|nr:trigger factor [Lachnospiraceae bacterium]